MWFLLLSLGAVILATSGLPALRRLPVAPPPEAVLALYFLVAAMVRLVVKNQKLAAWERKARKLARRTTDKSSSALGEIGFGVGRGVTAAVAGDLVMAGVALVAALLRGAAGSIDTTPPPQRERRRAVARERLRAFSCITGVGVVCAALAWEPIVHGRLVKATDAALRAAQDSTPARAATIGPAAPHGEAHRATPAPAAAPAAVSPMVSAVPPAAAPGAEGPAVPPGAPSGAESSAQAPPVQPPAAAPVEAPARAP